MSPQQKAKQIEKLLSRLIFDKRNVNIDVKSISDAQRKSGGYPSWRKYVVNIHVDPFKFNNVTDEYNEEYYEFLITVEDIVSESVKYIGIDNFVIDGKDDFIKMMEKMIYDKWEEVEMEYQIQTGKTLPDVDEISFRQRGISYPELTVYIGLRNKLYDSDHRAFWNAIHRKLPIEQMFVEIV